MGKVTGFLEIDRQVHKYQPASDRIRHFREFTLPMSDKEVEKQAARCMDCGVPFCHGPTGCPIHNQIPDWNDLVYNGDWDERDPQPAFDQQFPGIDRPHLPGALRGGLHPEPRGHPGRHQDDRAGDRRQGLRDSARSGRYPPEHKTGKRVAIIGSGPAGMAAAQQLGRAGHDVHVYERESQARRADALRHSRLQDREALHRPPRRADEGRGRHLPLRRQCRRRQAGRRAARRT